MNTSRVQEAELILAHFVPPEKLYKDVLLVYDGEGEKRTYTFVGMPEVDKQVMKTAVRELDRNQQGVISVGASEIISRHHEKDVRYSLHPLQRSYDLVHASGTEGKRFKEHIMVPGWVHNLERFRKPNLLFSDSYDYATGDRFSYEGEPTNVEISDKVVDTLIRGGAFKKPTRKVSDFVIGFDNNGESSVGSDWRPAEGCFAAGSGRPSCRGERGVAVFGKTLQKVKVETVAVPKRAYEREVAARKATETELANLKARMLTAREALA